MDFGSIVEGMAKIAEEANKAEEGDYIGEDGLLTCGKCHGKKQVVIDVPFRGQRTVYCMCPCKAKEFNGEQERRKREERQRRIRELRRMGFPDGDLVNCTFENDDGKNERITLAMKRYVENFDSFRREGKGLLLHGKIGTGKTYYAACIANALIDKGYPALVTNFSRLTNIIGGKFDGKQEYIDSLNDFELLVIDDLGAERRSEYMQEMVFNIIDNRYRSGLPLIITTNLTLNVIKDTSDMANSRIYDRVLKMCHPIEVDGINRRRVDVKHSFFEMNDMLGL